MSATTSFEELIKQQMKRLRRWNYNSSPKRGKTPESYNHTQILEIQYLVNNLLKFIKIIKHATALTNGGLSKRERKAEELLTDVMQNIQHIRERLLRCQQKVSTTKVHAKEIQLKRQQRELTNMIESLRTGNTKNLTRFAINSSEAIKYRIQRLGSKGKDSGLLQTDMSDLATKMDDIVDIIKDFKSVTDCGSSSDISLFTRRVASMCGENSSASQGILGLMEVRQAEMTQESSVDRSSPEQKKNFSNLANAAAKPSVSRKSREEQFLDRDEPNKTIQCLACGNVDSSLVFGDWPMYSEGSSLMPVASAANNNNSPYEKLATVAERFGFSSGDFFGDRANENQNRTAEGEFSLITSVVPTRAKESLRKRRKNERKEASVVEAPESKLGQSSETKGRTPVLTSMVSADSEKQTSVLSSDTSQSADGLLTMSSTSSVNTQISSTTTLVSSEISTNSSRRQLMSSVTKERILTTCITSSADKQTQSSPLVLSPANKHSQSSPLLSSANKQTQSSPLILSSANKQTQSSPLVLSSANKQTQSSPLVLSSADKQIQLSPLLSSADKQIQLSPLLSSADKQIQLSPLLSSADKQIHLSPLLSSADKQIQSSPLLSSANKQIQSSPLLSTDNKQIQSSPSLSSANKQIQSSPLLSSANKQIQSSPLLSTDNKQIQSSPLLSTDNKQIQSSPLLSSANKQIQSSPLLSSADKQIQSSPLLLSADTHIQSTTPTLSSATKQTQSSTPLQSHDDKESSSIAHLASSVMKDNSSSSLSSSYATSSDPLLVSSAIKADSSRTSQLSFATNENNDDDDNNTSATPSVHVGDVDDVWMLDDFGRLETFSAEAEERIERLRKLIEFPDLDNSSDAHVEAVAERVGEVAKTSHVKPTTFRTLATTVVVLLVIFAVACCCVESSSGFLYQMMSLVVQINPHGGEFY